MRELYGWGDPLINEDDAQVVAIIGHVSARQAIEEYLHHNCLYDCIEHERMFCEECLELVMVTHTRWRKVMTEDDWDANRGDLSPWGTGPAYPITTWDDEMGRNLEPFGY